MSKVGTEADFESTIVDSLVSYNKYIRNSNIDYDNQQSLLPGVLINFIKNTQSDSWTYFLDKFYNEEEAKKNFFTGFQKQRLEKGLLFLFRHGFTVRGITFDIVYWILENNLKPDTILVSQKNVFSVINQLCGTEHNDKTAIPDVVIFISGLPVVPMELKYILQKQDYKDVEEQYKKHSVNEPWFIFKYEAFVHFAVDENSVLMTTEIEGEDTYFMPFNLGSNRAGNAGGAGNPVVPKGKFNTYYLWENVFAKGNLLDIIQNILTIELDEKSNKENLIFSRYHQLDAVKKSLTDLKINGSSKNYLIEHSAESGMSNIIAWLAFHLQNLYFPPNNENIFDTIIVFNDHRVLDKQTRNTIHFFNSKQRAVIDA